MLSVQAWSLADPSYVLDSAFGVSSAPSISSDGQIVVFQSNAENIVSNDVNGAPDVFAYFRNSNAVRLISIGTNRLAAGTSGTVRPSISPDGRYVAFESDKSGILAGVSSSQLYLYDLQTDVISLLTPNAANTGAARVGFFSIMFTPDSRTVVFESSSQFAQDPQRNLTTNQVSGRNIFERHLTTQQTILVSVDNSGNGSGVFGYDPRSYSVSNDGRYIAFASSSNNYSSNDVNTSRDVFVRDTISGTTILVSVDETTLSAEGDSGVAAPSISGDGRFVTFVSNATVLNNVNPKGGSVVYVRDVQLNLTTAVSVPANNSVPNFNVIYSPVISSNGRFVSFASSGPLVSRDTNNRRDVYSFDRVSNVLSLISVNATGNNGGNADSGTTDGSRTPSVTTSPDGRYLFFRSAATNLVSNVLVSGQQLYRRDLQSGLTVLLTEGQSGLLGREAGRGDSDAFDVSRDGRYVAFESYAENFQNVSDSNGRRDILLKDMALGATAIASQRTSQLPAEVFISRGATLTSASSDGRFLAMSSSDGLRSGQNFPPDIARDIEVVDAEHILVRDTQTGLIKFVDLTPDGKRALGSDKGVISANGRFVAFRSNRDLDALHPNPNGLSQVFTRDLQSNVSTLISRSPSNGLAEQQANEIAISASGRYVAWTSQSRVLVSNLTGDTNSFPGHVYVWDRTNNSIRLVDHQPSSTTQLGNGPSYGIVFSPDESKIAFVSTANNLIAGVNDANAKPDLFVFDLTSGQVQVASAALGNSATGNGTSGDSSLFSGSKYEFSANGQYLVFTSAASNLVPVDTNNTWDVFRRDLTSNTTALVSANLNGTDSGNRVSFRSSISLDGQRIAFQSEATNLLTGMVNNNTTLSDVFVRDMISNTTVLASAKLNAATTTSNDLSQFPTISPDGRYVSFTAYSSDLVHDFVDGNASEFDLYVRDTNSGKTLLVTANQSGTASAAGKFAIDQNDIRIFGTNGVLYFNSTKPELVPGDRNQTGDVFSFRPLGTSEISGQLFNDLDGNGSTNGTEPGLSNWIVYLDQSNNGLLEADESRLQTSSSGKFAFTNLKTGNYVLRVIPRSGYRQITPDPINLTVTSDGQILTSNIGVQGLGADLSVTAVSAPDSAKIGGTSTISWTAINSGTSITGGWQDAVYLSQNPTLSSNAVLLATVSHEGGLGSNSSYNASVAVNWPASLAGRYYVIVQADRRGQVPFEKNRSNNSFAAPNSTTIDVTSLILNNDYNSDGFSSVGQEYFYRVDVPANNGSLGLQFTSAANSGGTSMYVRRGAIPTAWEYDFRSERFDQPNQFLVIPDPKVGTFYVMLRAESGPAASAGFTLRPDLTENLRILSIDRNNGGSGAPITIGIRGLNFTPQSKVKLVSASTAIEAQSIVFHDRSQLYATLNVNNPGGPFDVVVTDGNQSNTLPAAFTVSPGTLNSVVVQVIAPARVRYGRERVIVLEYSNKGNTDLVAPLLQIVSNNHKALFRNADVPYYRDDSVQVFATSPTGPAGILRPGQTERISIPFVSNTQIPHDLIDITVGAIKPLTNIDWDSLKPKLRPETVQADAWDVIWNSLRNMLGNTTDDYNFRLAQAANYLGDLGITPNNVGRVFGFLTSQVNAEFPRTTSNSTIDAELDTPGLSLQLDRTYLTSISGRYQLGMFGRGWSSSWESKLILNTSTGDIIIQSLGGGRRFVRQQNGLYQGGPGDYASLTSSSDGYTLLETNGNKSVFSAIGKLLFVEDSNGNRITLSYDVDGRLSLLKHSSGPTLFLAYNSQGRVSRVTDSAGRVVNYAYDGANGSGEHLISVTTVQGTTSYLTITGQGATTEHALSKITYRDGTSQSFTYDTLGRIIQTSRNGGVEALTYAYPNNGEVSITDSLGNVSTIWLNDAGLVERTIDAKGDLANFDYDDAFNLVRSIDPLGSSYRYSYNSKGYLTNIIDPLGQEAKFKYTSDTFIRLSEMVDARGNATAYSYDSFGNVHSITYPNGGKESFNYDPLGNLTETINRRGHAIKYTNDDRGRTTRIDFVDGAFQTFAYDSFDNLIRVVDETGTTTFEYDGENNVLSQNHLTKINYPGARFLAFSYDAAGRRIKSVDQDGFTVKYLYDSVGRLSELQDANGSLIVRYTYDAVGQLIQKDNGNGTRTTYSIDSVGQILSVKNYQTVVPTLVLNSHVDYTYDAAGRRTTMTDATGTTKYEYDAIGQLIGVTLPSGRTIQYKYDAAGNRTQVSDSAINGGSPVIYVANKENEITQVGNDAYTFDADGNLRTASNASGTTIYTFDDLNQLKSINGPEGKVSFVYDALGFRVEATRNGQATKYLIDPIGFGNVVGEYRTGESINYVHGAGLVGRFGTGGTGFYDFDGNANTIGLTGSSGTYVNQYSYLPLGETTGGGIVSNPFTFSGQFGLTSESTQLFYARARYYSVSQGQFVSRDPIGLFAGDMNFRRYVGNNPIDYIDPSGLDAYSNFNEALAREQEAESKVRHAVNDPVENSYNIAEYVRLRFETENAAEALLEQNKQSIQSLDKWPEYYLRVREQATGRAWESFKEIDDLIKPQDKSQTESLVPNDPNEIVGPIGYSSSLYIQPGGVWPYVIQFENKSDASAPAQDVIVTHQLDSDLDWKTFELGSFGFGSRIEKIPRGLKNYRTTVEYQNMDGSPLRVDVSFSFNRQTGVLTVVFRSIDPSTDLFPEDVFAGFLPPDDPTGRGQGFVGYTVEPLKTLASGTTVDQIASIVFDANEAISTPIFTNTIDSTPPTSAVGVLPLTQSATTFNVAWSGSDVNSGIAFFDVWVSDSDGPYSLWQNHTTSLSANYNGVGGHTYRFYSVAEDNVGNRELPPSVPDATTRIVVPPVAFDDRIGTVRNRRVDVDVLKNDNLFTSTATDVTIEIVTPPPTTQAIIQILPSNQIRIVPDVNYVGLSSFAYRLRDPGGLQSNAATVLIGVSGSPKQNPFLHTDVDASGQTNPLDVLVLINYINDPNSIRHVGGEVFEPPYLDVDGDGNVSPLDVLNVVNELNRSGNGEGEQSPNPSSVDWFFSHIDYLVDTQSTLLTKRRRFFPLQ